MAYEHQKNSGSMFKNKFKKANNHPDFKGSINVDGKIMDIAGWKSDRFDGMNLKISEPYKKTPQQTENISKSKEDNPDDPF